LEASCVLDSFHSTNFVHYTRLAAASDKAYQLLAHGGWFSPDSPASSTTKSCRHDIAEILLKVALNTINQPNQPINELTPFSDELYLAAIRLS
jgi:hypothetical protein